MTEPQDLLALVGEIDPYPEDSTFPEAWIEARLPIDRVIGQSPTQLVTWRSRPGIMVAAASAAVIVLLVGGLALLLRSQPLEPADQPTIEPDTPVTTVPPPSTTVPAPTTTVPPDSSSLGELTWASFPNELAPDIVAIVATDDGFLATSRTELWISADGISWTPGPLPFTPSADVSLEKDPADTYWLVHNSGSPLGAVGLWRSDDAVSWSQVDTSAIRLPSLSGVDWGVFPQRFFFLGGRDWESPIMVSNGDTIVASWRIIGSVPWQEILGLGFDQDGELDTSWDPQSQIFELTWRSWDHESETLGAAESVRLSLAVVSEDPLTVEATDVESGALVRTIIGSVEGFSTEELLAGIADGFNIDVVGVSDDGSTFETVSTPWAVNEVGSVMLAFQKYPRIVASGGRFYAYSVDVNGVEVENEFRPDSGTVETWTSADGRTWTSAGTPAFAEGQDVTGVTAVLERDGVSVVAVEIIDSNQKLWQSEDGVDWARIERGPTSEGQAHRADSGWVFTASVRPPTGLSSASGLFAMWVSQDGKNWQRVDSAEGLSQPVNGSGGHEADVAGDTVFVFNRFYEFGPADPPQGTVWIATLND